MLSPIYGFQQLLLLAPAWLISPLRVAEMVREPIARFSLLSRDIRTTTKLWVSRDSETLLFFNFFRKFVSV